MEPRLIVTPGICPDCKQATEDTLPDLATRIRCLRARLRKAIAIQEAYVLQEDAEGRLVSVTVDVGVN